MRTKNLVAAVFVAFQLLSPVQCFKQSSLNKSIQQTDTIRNYSQLENVISNIAISRYEMQIHLNPESEERYQKHKHPDNTPTDFSYWYYVNKDNMIKLKEIQSEFGVNFFSDPYKISEDMLKFGYTFSCTNSILDQKGISYKFGKVINDEKILNKDWGENKAYHIVIYEPIIPEFENYTNELFIMSSILDKNELIFINKAEIEDYSRKINDKCKTLKKLDKDDFDFYGLMLLKECDSDLFVNNMARKYEKAMIHHEMNHDYSSEEDPDGERIALLSQIYYQPRLGLAIIYDLSKGDFRDDKAYQNASAFIFSEFEKRGYTKERLVKAKDKEIRIVVKDIIINAITNKNF